MTQNFYDKVAKYKKDFYNRFIDTNDPEGSGTYIPLDSINSNNIGIVGDGTINMAHFLQYLYFTNQSEEITKCLAALKRLSKAAIDYFGFSFPYDYESGFFMRDDLDLDNFPHLKQVIGAYTTEYLEDTFDPCFSAFTSQDQVWNLLPILKILSLDYPEAKELIKDYVKYIVENNYVIYNPYYSWDYHKKTYYDLRVPYDDRYDNLLNHFKYNIKVKRGANCWYYGGGFVNVYNSVATNKLSEFWHRQFYKTFVWIADNIYHPYICKWFKLPVKNNAYYCLNVASGNKTFIKKVISKFKKNIKETLAGKAELNEDYAWLYLIASKMNGKIETFQELADFLEQYEVPTGKSPLLYLTLASLW